MTTCKGIVRGNIVVPEEGADLPDGAKVEIHLTERSLKRDEAFDRVFANRITRYVGIDKIIKEDKKENTLQSKLQSKESSL